MTTKIMIEKIEILFKTNTWMAVNKPSGLSVHNDEDETNLVKSLRAQGYEDYSPVHRLDKETSGVMLLSSDSKVSAELQGALQQESTRKHYLAIVKGAFATDKSEGVWDKDLTNKAEGRLNPLGVKGSRVNCKTNYKVLNANKYLSLLLLDIETGRQHQIRKHSVLDKHQVIGDARYGDRKFNSLIRKKYSFSSMALHSHSLSFNFNGEEHCFVSYPDATWSKLEVYKRELV